MTHRLIGEILKETCTLSEDALDEALKIQKEKGGRIGEILVRQKAISKVDLLEALSIQFDLPFSLTLPIEDLKTGFTEKVPIQFLKKTQDYTDYYIQWRPHRCQRSSPLSTA